MVLTRITRQRFGRAELPHAIEPRRVVCSDESAPSVEAESFQSRLWAMFPHTIRGLLSLPQIDRVRWLLFFEIRIPTQASLFDAVSDEADLPGTVRVMDLQQEQLARSIGDGHRAIHKSPARARR